MSPAPASFAVGAPQWGQKLTVDLVTPAGSLVRLVDYDLGVGPGGVGRGLRKRGLTCIVNVKRHLLPEPYTSETQIYNLPLALRELLANTVRVAREFSYVQQQTIRAGRIIISAGRDPARFGVIADDQIIACDSKPSGGDVITTISGVDGRLAWDSLFSTSSSFGPPIAASVAARMGIPPPPVPDPLPKTVVTYHLHGAEKEDALAVFAKLGMIPVWRGDLVVWLPTNGVLALPPVTLDTIALDPLASGGDNGVRVQGCLHDPWLLNGRQAFLRAEVLRIESLESTLDTYGNPWYSNVKLRPVGA